LKLLLPRQLSWGHEARNADVPPGNLLGHRERVITVIHSRAVDDRKELRLRGRHAVKQQAQKHECREQQ
jgi:hypothetical protein